MMRLYLLFSQSKNPLDSLTSGQLDSVTTLAQGMGPAATQAKNVLHILKQTDPVPEIPEFDAEITEARLSAPTHNFIITNYYTFDKAQVKVSPNPASIETTIEYRFASPVSKPVLVICDLTGKKVMETILNQNESTQTISTANLLGGIYYLQLMDGNNLLKSSPLVIIK